MKVVVLGAGIIGVTSAYYLNKAGHEVTIIDRQPGPALETSYANAGEISPGYASPWAAPGIPLKALKWLFMKHAPLIVQPRFDARTLAWLTVMLRNCTARRYAENKSRMMELAEFSRDELGELRAELKIDYDQRTQGTLQLFRTQRQLEASANDVDVLKSYGVPFELLDRAGCIKAEPGLAHTQAGIAGGLRLPNDETGDCYKFAAALSRWLERQGVTMLFSASIRALQPDNGLIRAIDTSLGRIEADAVVVCLGSYSPGLVQPLGIQLPIYPVKGYSITKTITDRERAPVSTLLDESYKIAITRLGDRIRVGGMAEIAGYDRSMNPKRKATLLHSLDSLFPSAAQGSETSFWSGFRPMTPDGPPIVSKTAFRNLFINSGHGTLGWTMACGSAHVVTSLVNGEKPAIDARGLSYKGGQTRA